MCKIGLGGGCHWCTEAVFAALRGVADVAQGWIASDPPAEAFSEAVVVTYDPTVIAVEDLIAVHLATHAATADHALRGRYRSAVYYFEEEAPGEYATALERLAEDYERPLLTQILPFRSFRASLPEHQNYYFSEPNRPFCRRYIAPKLKYLQQHRPDLVHRGAKELPN